MKKVRVVYVSNFSSVDFFGIGWERNGVVAGFSCEKNIHAALMNAARCKNSDGSSVIEIIEISKEEYKSRKEYKDENGDNVLADNVAKINGKYLRSRLIEEISGYEIRAAIEKKYGKNVIIIYIGGPPCQDFTKLNMGNKKNRNILIFEYLRILRELQPDIACMEQVTDIKLPIFAEIWNEFKRQAVSMDYQFGTLEMNALNYGGSQFRDRIFCQWIANKFCKTPVWPEATRVNAKKAGEIVPLDYFFSGHLTDRIKTKDDYMCCLTSSSPKWFANKVGITRVKRTPTIEELLRFQGVRPGEIIVPDYIPFTQARKVVGNGVEVNLSELLSKTIIEKVLCLRHIGDGWFVPIDSPDEGTASTSKPEDTPTPIVTPEDSVSNSVPTDLIKQVEKASVYSKERAKQHGEVFTPTAVAQEMVDSLPADTWANPDKTTLDPCAGRGIFPAILITRYMEGLKDVFPDELIRYRHILEKIIYMAELQADNALTIDRIFNPDKIFSLNLYVGDALTMPEDFFNLPYDERLKKYPQNCVATYYNIINPEQ